MTRPPIQLMLVEDNLADVFLLESALDLTGLPVQLTVARDGQDALDQLRDRHAAGCLPPLVLLDLNMPRVNGFEALEMIRADPDLAPLVVVVFTTSNAEMDIRRAYALQANSYVSKPDTLDAFLALIKSLEAYWFGVASLPRSYAPN
ncbi:response regulator (plasmid) [Deinococcus taeanensis]|uniref:response regulator n=1 Tax=Deinococcus taeanensis TaxID=2737050 RepID=UPI001CDCCF25|nr:response regulator [Deinococcus taeanensis]UBV44887.1 response regulator [Deinococcus taeanensis]